MPPQDQLESHLHSVTQHGPKTVLLNQNTTPRQVHRGALLDDEPGLVPNPESINIGLATGYAGTTYLRR